MATKKLEKKIKQKLRKIKKLGAIPMFQQTEKLNILKGSLLRPWDFPGKNTGAGCHFLLQGIFLTQGSNSGFQHCRQTLYRLSHQGSPIYTKVPKNMP